MNIILHAKRLLSLLPQYELDLADYQQKSCDLYAIEARHTLFHLKRLLSDSSNHVLDKTLKNFLTKRWHMIKNLDLQYCYDLSNPANRFCIEVAKALSDVYEKSYLLLLMPTLAQVSSEQYITSGYDDDSIDLKHIILSDDHTRIIHIYDVLDFAKVDGKLKHNSLFDGFYQELTISEQHRLLSKNPAVEQYYLAIQDKLNFVLYGETAGAYLQRLINGLRAGGVSQNTEDYELNAGDQSNFAIIEFDSFLSALDEAKREKLLMTGKFDRWESRTPSMRSIEVCWNRLARPADSNGDDTMYCVELIANYLEEILYEHIELYELLPFDAPMIKLAEIEEQVAEAKSAMITALSGNDTIHFHGQDEDKQLIIKVIGMVKKDVRFILKPHEITYIAKLYSMHNKQSESEQSQCIARECAESLTKIGRFYFRNILNKALQNMTPEVQADVRHMLVSTRPTMAPIEHRFFRSQINKRQVESSMLDASDTKELKRFKG